MTTRVWGEEYRTTTICVDSYTNGVMCGCFYNPCLKGGKEFQSTTQFLLEMEQALDTMDFPRSFTATRKFATPSKQSGKEQELSCRTGQTATFAVRILFRQNASWQGSVTWLEGKREQSFRSVLELLLLIDSALTCEKAS